MNRTDIVEIAVGGVALAIGATSFVMEIGTRKRLKKVEAKVNALDVNGLNRMAANFAASAAQQTAQQPAQPEQSAG